MGFPRLGPIQSAVGQLQQSGRIGLDDVRRRTAGVATALTDAQLHRRVRRHPQLDGPAGELLGQQRTHRAYCCGHLCRRRISELRVPQGTDGIAHPPDLHR